MLPGCNLTGYGMALAFVGTGPDLVGPRSDRAGQVLADASPGWLRLGFPGSGGPWVWVSLALPWSDLDHWHQLAQTNQDWACQGKLAHAQPDPGLAGATWSWLYPGLTPAWLGLDLAGPAGS